MIRCLCLALAAAAVAAAVSHEWRPLESTELFPRAMVRYSRPLELTLAVGASLARQGRSGDFSGPLLEVEAGGGGCGLTAAWRAGRHMGVPVVAAGAGLSLLHLWEGEGRSGSFASKGWHLGAVAVFQAAFLELRGGACRRLSGGEDGPRWGWSAGVGLGLI